MKLTINVDCTPEEARSFFGLPDLTPVNDILVSSLEARVKENIDTLSDPQKYFERVMQMSGSGMENMQKMFATMMAGAASQNDR